MISHYHRDVNHLIQGQTQKIGFVFKSPPRHLHAQMKLETQKEAKRDPDYVVAPNVHISNKSLPSCSNSNPWMNMVTPWSVVANCLTSLLIAM